MTLTTRAKAKTLASAASSAVLLASLPALAQQSTLRVVPHSDRKIVDPIWTPA